MTSLELWLVRGNYPKKIGFVAAMFRSATYYNSAPDSENHPSVHDWPFSMALSDLPAGSIAKMG